MCSKVHLLQMQHFAGNSKDWIQSALAEKYMDSFDFEHHFAGKQDFIARGGSGDIYLGTSLILGKTYALKYLRQPNSVGDDPEGYKSFVHELQLIRQVDDEDFVARCYGVSWNPMTKEYMMVMKYAEQGPLDKYLMKSAKLLSWTDKLRLAIRITQALNYIHNKRVIHRDLHSGNILIDAAGKPLIADFGLNSS